MSEIRLWGVKQNNLKNLDIKVPLGAMTVVCGPSGSGKSSLAFETLFAEGQRRFIESMSNYARQFLNKAPKPSIDGIENIPPSIAIEQKNSVRGSRSTVGTTTEVSDYLRLLFEKIGQFYCPTHHVPIASLNLSQRVKELIQNFEGKRAYLLVEFPIENRLMEGPKLLSQLLADGFLRVMIPPQEVLDLNPKSKALLKAAKGAFYLVVDRLAISNSEEGRILDSMRVALNASVKYQKHPGPKRVLVLTTDQQKYFVSDLPGCPHCGFTPAPFNSKWFSFNSPIGACTTCKGFGNILDIDESKVVPNPNLSISQGALEPFRMPSAAADRKQLLAYCRRAGIDPDIPWVSLPQKHKGAIWNGNKDFFGVRGLFEYLEQLKYKMHVRVFISRYRSPSPCPDCRGTRLRGDIQHILIRNKSYNELNALPLQGLYHFLEQLKPSEFELSVAAEIYKQLLSRVGFLLRVGVHYIHLNRETRTLSGGEFQRLVLAKQLGMGLSQTLYVLDEPTIGLHPRDNDRLISVLKDLKDLGNTVVIVEHDQDVILESDYVIEMGPGSGHLGGQLVFSGKKSEFLKSTESLTAQYLCQRSRWTPHREPRPVEVEGYRYRITLRGARGHNLAGDDVVFPLNRLIAVTGVSGSGKSTLITRTLYPALMRALDLEYLEALPYTGIEGVENLKNVVLIDQSSIGKTARSSPVSYMKAFDAVRGLMAGTFEARARGYTPGTFSLNVDGGRCPDCKGTGYEEIDMMFMDNVLITCETCDGKKYLPEVLEIKLKNKNIYDILNMTVLEAMNFFAAYPNIWRPLSVLRDVGLEYLQVGQPASTLSGGESQRLKIARELNQSTQRSTLYILDEPTTGLHFREIELLMKVLHKLIEGGNSVIVIEHNLDVIKDSDFVIDLGPDAGATGGRVIAAGTPDEILRSDESLTARYLRKHLHLGENSQRGLQ